MYTLVKLMWAFRLLKSKSFVVVTDKNSVISIPMFDVESFESRLILASQMASLKEFNSRLEDVIKEHKEKSELLARKEDIKE